MLAKIEKELWDRHRKKRILLYSELYFRRSFFLLCSWEVFLIYSRTLRDYKRQRMGDWPDISLMTLLLSVKQIQPEEGRDGEWRGMEGLLNMVLFSESAHRQSLRFLYGLFGGFCLRAEFLRQPGYFPPGTLLSLFFRMCCTYTHFWFHTQPHELARSEWASSVWSCVWVGVSSHSPVLRTPKRRSLTESHFILREGYTAEIAPLHAISSLSLGWYLREVGFWYENSSPERMWDFGLMWCEGIRMRFSLARR